MLIAFSLTGIRIPFIKAGPSYFYILFLYQNKQYPHWNIPWPSARPKQYVRHICCTGTQYCVKSPHGISSSHIPSYTSPCIPCLLSQLTQSTLLSTSWFIYFDYAMAADLCQVLLQSGRNELAKVRKILSSSFRLSFLRRNRVIVPFIIQYIFNDLVIGYVANVCISRNAMGRSIPMIM